MQALFDTNWRARALAGEPEAVKALAEQALRPLYCFCLYRVGRNEHLCEEIVQETLIRALHRLEDYEPARSNNNIAPWLIGLARNEIQRVLARERPSVSLDLLWARMDRELLPRFAQLDADPFNEELLQRAETRELVNATMSQIPSHYKDVLEGKYVSGKSVRDLAGMLSLSEKAVESLLSRARQAFRVTFLALARNLELEVPEPSPLK